MALTLPTRASYPSFLNKAIELANLMVHSDHRFEQYLHASAVTRSRLNNITVEFQEGRVSGGWNAYSWSDRRVDASTIFVNRVLRDRLERITTEEASCSDSHEYQCIVFMIVVALFHECAELTLHWQGILDPPSKFLGGVGNCAERRLFFSLSRLKIQKNPQWKGLAIEMQWYQVDTRYADHERRVTRAEVEDMGDETRALGQVLSLGSYRGEREKTRPCGCESVREMKGASMHLGCKRP